MGGWMVTSKITVLFMSTLTSLRVAADRWSEAKSNGFILIGH